LIGAINFEYENIELKNGEIKKQSGELKAKWGTKIKVGELKAKWGTKSKVGN